MSKQVTAPRSAWGTGYSQLPCVSSSRPCASPTQSKLQLHSHGYFTATVAIATGTSAILVGLSATHSTIATRSTNYSPISTTFSSISALPAAARCAATSPNCGFKWHPILLHLYFTWHLGLLCAAPPQQNWEGSFSVACLRRKIGMG